MILRIYSLFNRIDGSGASLQLSRTDERIVREIVSTVSQRNAELKEKEYSLIDLGDYELRYIGDFEDTTCCITPVNPPVVVPLTVK